MTNCTANPMKLSYDPEVARKLRPMVDAATLASVGEWVSLKSSSIRAVLLAQSPYPVWMIAAALVAGMPVGELLACGAVRILADSKKADLPRDWQQYVDPISRVRKTTVFQSIFGPAFGQPYYLLEKTG